MKMVGQQSESLTAKLRTQVREQLAEADALTKDELQQHAQRLTKQCSDVLSQTESVISGQSQSLSGLQRELQTTKEALQRTLSEARNTAERSLLSHLEQERLKQQLHDQLKVAHSEAVAGQLTPLKRELQAIRREAEALSRTTARAWLKPLLIGASVAIGICIVVAGGLKVADVLIAKRAEQLQALNERISAQQMTLTRLQGATWGVDLKTIEGRWYIVLPEGKKADPNWTVEGRPAVLME